MSSILGFIARFVDEKLSAARVLIGLLLLTLVTNGSLLLAQYGPPSGFDAPMPAFDAASGPEESGEPVPNAGALAEGKSSAPPPSPSGVGRSSTVTRESGTLAAGDAEDGRQGGSTSKESFTLLQSTELLGAVSSSGLPSVLGELVPDGLGKLVMDGLRELVPDDLDDLFRRGAFYIVGGEDPQAGGGPQAGEGPQGGRGPQGSGGPPASGGQPADEGAQGSEGQPADEGPQGSGDPPASGGPKSDGGPKDGGSPEGDGGPKGGGNPEGDGGPKGGGSPEGGGGPKGGGGR